LINYKIFGFNLSRDYEGNFYGDGTYETKYLVILRHDSSDKNIVKALRDIGFF
jgi:hypothetical protein